MAVVGQADNQKQLSLRAVGDHRILQALEVVEAVEQYLQEDLDLVEGGHSHRNQGAWEDALVEAEDLRSVHTDTVEEDTAAVVVVDRHGFEEDLVVVPLDLLEKVLVVDVQTDLPVLDMAANLNILDCILVDNQPVGSRNNHRQVDSLKIDQRLVADHFASYCRGLVHLRRTNHFDLVALVRRDTQS